MKTAKEILYEKAAQNNDGFLSGQMKWLIEAMNEYASQTQPFSKADYEAGFDQGYKEGYADAHATHNEWSA